MMLILRRKRNILILLIPLGFLLTSWAKSSAKVAEIVFATGIYKVLSQVLSLLTGWIPFSLMELVIIVGPLTVLALMIRQIIRHFKPFGRIAKDKKRLLSQTLLDLPFHSQRAFCRRVSSSAARMT